MDMDQDNMHEDNEEWNKSHPFYYLDEHEFYGTDPGADYDRWSKAPYWTAEEATALSYGKNPRVVNWAFLSSCPEHPFARQYNDRLDHVIRAQKLGQLPSLIQPPEFIRFARPLGIEFPAELETAIGQISRDGVRDWQAEYAALARERDTLAAKRDAFERTPQLDKPLLESERRTMLTIIAATAVAGYGFVPSGNSKIPQEIVDDLAKMGLSLDVKTVRKYLQSAAELIPPEDTKKR